MKKDWNTLFTIFIVTVILTSVTCLGQNNWECSKPCKCKWVSGRKTADCIRQDLTEIPENLSSQIQHLDLTGNNITQIQHDAFSTVHLVNLHKLILRECKIQSVHTDAFSGLEIVIEIDLSMNKIRTLYPGTFAETHRLRVLLLNDNSLEVLEAGLFSNMTFLQRVVISNNKLKRIEEKTFRQLPGLQTLILHSNSLSSLKYSTFEELHKLGSLELHNNPWNCNCLLKKFRDWAMERKLYAKPTTCKQPATLAGKMWDEIESEEFACIPKIVSIGPSSRLEIAIGDDANLWCHALGTPRPTIFWVHRTQILTNSTNRRRIGADRTLEPHGYIVRQFNGWANLTVPRVSGPDRGDYICVAQNFGGSVERNVTMVVSGELLGSQSSVGLPLAIGLGVIVVLLVLLTLALFLYYCRKKKLRHHEKGPDTGASMDHHGLGEQEKSLIATMNPVVKPANRRYEIQSSVNARGTEMTELNRTLLDNDSIFADGVSSVGGVGVGVGGISSVNGGIGMSLGIGNGSISNGLGNGTLDDDRERSIHTPELENEDTLCRVGGVYPRPYPPDLLAFSGGRGASPTSQASTAPDNSRLPNQFGTLPNSSHYKTLPHNRSGNPTPPAPVLPRYGYVTIPRRPRAPSWGSSGSPMASSAELLEPVYDNLGRRCTADGSSKLSLNKSPEPVLVNRPLPATPPIMTTAVQSHYSSSPPDRVAPEGAAEWPVILADESRSRASFTASTPNAIPNRKIPPRPPPKPKKKTTQGPLYEDEGEDGTEV